MKNKTFLFVLLFLPCFLSAQMKSYDYYRKLNKPSGNDYFSIKILPAIMAKSKSNLSDIRIYEAREKDTVEIPYILEWLGSTSEEFEVTSQMINESYREKCCSFATFKFERKESINRIQLKIEEDNFDKSIKIEGSDDNKKWFTIREHLRIVGYSNGETKVKYASLNFPSSEYTYFRLTLDDINSARIKIFDVFTMDIDTRKPGSYSELPIVTRKDSLKKQNKTTEITLDLGQNYFLSHVVLFPKKEKDFFRNVNVYCSLGKITSPKGVFENWSLEGTGVLRSDDENKFSFFNSNSSKIKIEIFNQDDQPVEIPEIKVFSEDCQLVTQLPVSDNLFLCYGKTNDNSPTYDMAHFEEKIPDKLNAINYGDEVVKASVIAETNPLFKEKIWLWVILGLVILVIAVFSLRMLNASKNEKS